MGEPRAPEPADRRTLAAATVLALAIAAIGLALVILPQSFGIDPTGLGAAMGFEPDPGAGAEDGATEVTLVVGANRSFAYPFPLAAGEAVHIVWNSTGPLQAALSGTDPEGGERPVEASWGGNATWQATTLTAPFTGRYTLAWANAGAGAVTVHVRIVPAH